MCTEQSGPHRSHPRYRTPNSGTLCTADQPCRNHHLEWPLGVFEIDQFGRGTKRLARAVAKSKAFSVVGGGDTLAALEKYGVAEKISYISTGGGLFWSSSTAACCRRWRCLPSVRSRILMLVRNPESELLIALFREGLAAALPDRCLPLYLPTEPSKGTTLVLGAGKAAAGMAATLAACYLSGVWVRSAAWWSLATGTVCPGQSLCRELKFWRRGIRCRMRRALLPAATP